MEQVGGTGSWFLDGMERDQRYNLLYIVYIYVCMCVFFLHLSLLWNTTLFIFYCRGSFARCFSLVPLRGCVAQHSALLVWTSCLWRYTMTSVLRRLRVCVVGLGEMGLIHARNLIKFPGVELSLACKRKEALYSVAQELRAAR